MRPRSHRSPANQLRPPLALRPRRLVLRRLRRSAIVFWLAAVALAGVAASTVASSTPAGDRVAYDGRTRLVPVASDDLRRGHRVEPDDVEWRELPEAAIPSGNTPEPAETEGRVVVEPIGQGEVVVEARLAPDGLDGTAALLPPGTRAIAVPITLGVPPLQVGDRVDLLATLDATSAEAVGGRRVTARDATVVAVEDDAVTVAVDEDDAGGTAEALATGAIVIALVSPE